MWFRNGNLQFNATTKTMCCLVPLPSVAVEDENWRHKRPKSWTGMRTIYWKQEWDKKAVTATALMAHGTRKEWFMWKPSDNRQYWMVPSSSTSPQKGTLLLPLVMTWGDTKLHLGPSHAASCLLQKLTLSGWNQDNRLSSWGDIKWLAGGAK